VRDIQELRRQGLTVTQISAVTGFSRPTVRRYLKDPKTPVYGPQTARPSKLDPFKPYMGSPHETEYKGISRTFGER
jgi:transposase